MFTHKDLEFRSIFVINCIENKALHVDSGELLLKDTDKNKTLTKLPFQKILVLFVIGHVTITTALIDKCTKYGIPLVVMKPNFRPVFFFSITAEANYLLRQRQYNFEKSDLCVAKTLVINKISNQLRLLEKSKLKTEKITIAKNHFPHAIEMVQKATNYETIMGLEGRVAKFFFQAYFEALDWKCRCPRAKTDPINVTLDIGYTILFNYIEAFVRLFGFDPYQGVYHRLWFRRKSLICDLMEPFRCLIDNQVRNAFRKKQCKWSDFELYKNEYKLKREKNADYCKMFYDVLIEEKQAVFKYIRDYYRCFMNCKSTTEYPQYILK